MSDDRTQREKALILAATTNVRQEPPADVVAAAEKYLAFLDAGTDTPQKIQGAKSPADEIIRDSAVPAELTIPGALADQIDEILYEIARGDNGILNPAYIRRTAGEIVMSSAWPWMGRSIPR